MYQSADVENTLDQIIDLFTVPLSLSISMAFVYQCQQPSQCLEHTQPWTEFDWLVLTVTLAQ